MTFSNLFAHLGYALLWWLFEIKIDPNAFRFMYLIPSRPQIRPSLSFTRCLRRRQLSHLRIWANARNSKGSQFEISFSMRTLMKAFCRECVMLADLNGYPSLIVT